MRIGKSAAIIGVGLALAVGLTGCGGDEPAPAASSTMGGTSAPAPATSAADPAPAESTEQADPGAAPTEGVGGQVDAGYMRFEVPDGMSWEVADSPCKGYAVARVHVGSFPDQVGMFFASTTTMADSMESALDEMVNELEAFGGGHTEPVQVTYGEHTYWQSTHPSMGIYLATYDAASGLFVEHVLEPNDDGTGFDQDEAVRAILDSITYQTS